MFAVRRVIRLHWCLFLHPELIQTAFDVATWGRFRVFKRRPGRRVVGRLPTDGSDFQI